MADPHDLGGDYARDTHRGGLGDDYAREGGWSGAGRADDYIRDSHGDPKSSPRPDDPLTDEDDVGDKPSE